MFVNPLKNIKKIRSINFKNIKKIICWRCWLAIWKTGQKSSSLNFVYREKIVDYCFSLLKNLHWNTQIEIIQIFLKGEGGFDLIILFHRFETKRTVVSEGVARLRAKGYPWAFQSGEFSWFSNSGPRARRILLSGICESFFEIRAIPDLASPRKTRGNPGTRPVPVLLVINLSPFRSPLDRIDPTAHRTTQNNNKQ